MPLRFALIPLALALSAATACAQAVEVTLHDGQVVEGVVLRESQEEVVLRLRRGTMGIQRRYIKAIERVAAPASTAAVDTRRLPGWDAIVLRLARHPDADTLRQIPATVVEVGDLRNVPYMSHRFGPYELNVYGDPDRPAGVEVGVVRGQPQTDLEKRDCVRLVRDLLTAPEDRAVVEALRLDQDHQERDGLAFDITPPTAEDAFGGWWVTVQDAAAREAARATDAELARITSRRGARGDDVYAWSAEEYAEARRRPNAAVLDPLSYVRGYHRREDGQYDRPAARRRAGR